MPTPSQQRKKEDHEKGGNEAWTIRGGGGGGRIFHPFFEPNKERGHERGREWQEERPKNQGRKGLICGRGGDRRGILGELKAQLRNGGGGDGKRAKDEQEKAHIILSARHAFLYQYCT